MGKLVVIRLEAGCFECGFPVLLRIAEDSQPCLKELKASLPKNLSLNELYQDLLKNGVKVLKPNINKPKFKDIFNSWLYSPEFLPKWSELLTDCTSQNIIRVVLQTQDPELARLPWHLWKFFESYPLAEMAFSLPEYNVQPCYSTRSEIKILAILGDSKGIDITVDEREFKQLCPNTCFLPEKNQETIFRELRDETSWDILFFAGHSKTSGEQGILCINQTDRIKIDDLENAVKQAIKKGLRLAIFNSCDGLGLAKTLASWNVPQVIVMREPIPDEVAHKFLKFFLEAFVKNEKNLYLALRQARENLQEVEGRYSLAS